MTEAEWLASADPTPMLEFLRSRARLDPRLRRFAVECCRRIGHLITDDVFRAAAHAGEAFADDPQNSKSTIKAMAQAALRGRQHQRRSAASADPHQHRVADAAIATCAPTDWHAAFKAVRAVAQAVNRADPDACDPVEIEHQAVLLRCTFGNPFRPSPALPPAVLAWNDRTVPRLAEAIYEERKMPEGTLDTGRLAILADALLDAGCDDEEVLAHCRSPGPHVRGCWAVDLCLGLT
jgi:hypothetical protein